MIDTPAIPETPQLTDELRECIRAAASWDVVHRPVTPGTFPTRVRAARRASSTLSLTSLS